MSRRQYTTLILQVRIPVPAGKTQAGTVEWVKAMLTRDYHDDEPIRPFASPQTQVKLTGKETHYL